MNDRFRKLAEQCTETSTSYFDGRGNVTETYFNREKFAELIYKDIITVVAAQALSNHSALEVFLNLTRIYEGSKE